VTYGQSLCHIRAKPFYLVKINHQKPEDFEHKKIKTIFADTE